jgi:hypothetical protein
MQRYRKKPVEIEAVRLPNPRQGQEENGTYNEISAWCGGEKVNDAVDGWCILIETLEGQMKARPGDWIIKGVAGEFYPCKPEIFEATYEAV